MRQPKATALTMAQVDEILSGLTAPANVRQVWRSGKNETPVASLKSLALHLGLKAPSEAGLMLLDLKRVLLQGFAEKDAKAVAAAIYLGANPYTTRATKRSLTPLQMADRDPDMRPWSRLMRTAWAKTQTVPPSSIALIYGNTRAY